MATTGVYNKFKTQSLGSLTLPTDDIRVLLVSSSYTFDADHHFVSDVVASELSGTGYARVALTSKTLTEDDTNDRSIFNAANLTYTAINAGTIDAAIVYKEAASDATRQLVCCLDITPKVPTNGGNINLNWAATIGILRAISGSQVYNRGLELILGGLDLSSSDVRTLLVSSSYTYDPDHNFVSDLTNELSGTGYARKALTTKTVTEDDTNDRGVFDADDLTWVGANFGTPAAAIVYLENTTDATRELIARIALSPSIVTNTGDFIVAWSGSLGILRGT